MSPSQVRNLQLAAPPQCITQRAPAVHSMRLQFAPEQRTSQVASAPLQLTRQAVAVPQSTVQLPWHEGRQLESALQRTSHC